MICFILLCQSFCVLGSSRIGKNEQNSEIERLSLYSKAR